MAENWSMLYSVCIVCMHIVDKEIPDSRFAFPLLCNIQSTNMLSGNSTTWIQDFGQPNSILSFRIWKFTRGKYCIENLMQISEYMGKRYGTLNFVLAVSQKEEMPR